MIVNPKAKGGKAYSVALNGVEVTSRCFYADDERGEVRCYELNSEGQMYCLAVGAGALIVEILHGTVVITALLSAQPRTAERVAKGTS